MTGKLRRAESQTRPKLAYPVRYTELGIVLAVTVASLRHLAVEIRRVAPEALVEGDAGSEPVAVAVGLVEPVAVVQRHR